MPELIDAPGLKRVAGTASLTEQSSVRVPVRVTACTVERLGRIAAARVPSFSLGPTRPQPVHQEDVVIHSDNALPAVVLDVTGGALLRLGMEASRLLIGKVLARMAGQTILGFHTFVGGVAG